MLWQRSGPASRRQRRRESPPAHPTWAPLRLILRRQQARGPRPRRSAAVGPTPSRTRRQRGLLPGQALQLWVSAKPVSAAAKPKAGRTQGVGQLTPLGMRRRTPGRSPLTVSCAPAASAGRSGPPARGRLAVLRAVGVGGDAAPVRARARPSLPAGPSPEARPLRNRRLGSLRLLAPQEVWGPGT